MVAVAREVGGDSHGFRFIQLPFNLAMPEALTLRNQTLSSHQVSTLEAAAGLGVTVISSASIFQGKVAQGLPQGGTYAIGRSPTEAVRVLRGARVQP